jgi:hypothetical protein
MSEEIIWRLTLTIGPARKILELIDIARGEGMGPDTDDIMRAVAWQHPDLVDEFSHLPWPMKRKRSRAGGARRRNRTGF